jgi:uncharacterized protein YbaP (TraB family)
MKIVIAFLLVISSNLVAQVSNPGLLWEITHPNQTGKSYLFGTFHSNLPQLMQMQDSTWCALMNSTTAVFEVDIQSELANRFSYFDARVYSQRALNKNYATSSYTAYGNEDGWPQFMDMMLYEKAVIQNKNVRFLESIDDQLNIMDGYDLLSVDSEYEKSEFISAYLKGDIIKLQRMLRENTSDSFFERLITKRNGIMANGMDTLMKTQTIFCAVGAGHLAGKEGVIMNLRAKGYTLRKVGLGEKQCTIEQRKVKNYTQVLENKIGTHIFPGKPLRQTEDSLSKYTYCEFGQGNLYQMEVIPLKSGITYADLLKDLKNRAITVGVLETSSFNGIDGLETMSKIEDGALTWERLLNLGEYALILSCHGGEKFMRSNRPTLFFDGFKKD